MALEHSTARVGNKDVGCAAYGSFRGCNANELIDNYRSININKIDNQQGVSELLLRALDNDYQEDQRQLVTTHNKDTVYDDDADMSYDEDEDYFESNGTECDGEGGRISYCVTFFILSPSECFYLYFDKLFRKFTGKGSYVGAPCENTCNADLQHVICDAITGVCECEKQYPVRLGPTRGCAKPKRLGEQCFYRATCVFTDQHATCAQVQHNAVCDCDSGYHKVAIARPKKVFCAEDLVLITADMPTLLGIVSGIAVLTGLICFVLKLFSRARYTRPRHYADANHAPPMLFSSDTAQN
ncbi:hypothetical protein PV328_007289 [Microctonus aethiopoides]|uniref:EB domain-containing protein n=1 Tax=Microctonus aethiopoides TaxID=144406 RepID=A0AA39FQX0_9HYME|nr:hypothetical protein PV328_007289 [Microctonus aethiopoides]